MEPLGVLHEPGGAHLGGEIDVELAPRRRGLIEARGLVVDLRHEIALAARLAGVEVGGVEIEGAMNRLEAASDHPRGRPDPGVRARTVAPGGPLAEPPLPQEDALTTAAERRADDRPLLERDVGGESHRRDTLARTRSPPRAATLALALALAPALACAGRPSALRYTVEVPATLDHLAVEACFEGPRPPRLVADDERAAELLVDPRDPARGASLAHERGAESISLAGLAGPCVAYTVDLDALGRGRSFSAVASGDDRVITSGLVFWRPPSLPDGLDATARFILPDGLEVSTAWPRLAGDAPTFRLDPTAFRWRSQVVVGRFTPLRFDHAGVALEVASVGGRRRLTDEGARRWLGAAIDAVAGLYGAFPVPTLQIIIVPIPGDDEPVYFGVAGRGGGASALLLVADGADDDAFPGEWVAIHELLHLGMPFVSRDDAWLSEGFVTYYTEVARARAGLRTPERAWRALTHGFARGAADLRPGRDLAAITREMDATHAYSWIYWGGAAIALTADVALREATGGARGLDAAMAHLRECCARSPRVWGAAEVLTELDRWAGRAWLVPLADRLLAGSGFAELPALYTSLGIGGSDLADAPAATTRDAIMRPSEARKRH